MCICCCAIKLLFFKWGWEEGGQTKFIQKKPIPPTGHGSSFSVKAS